MWGIIVIVSAVFAIVGIILGLILIFRKDAVGEIHLKWGGRELDAGIGPVLLLAAFVVIGICAWRFNPSLEKEIDRLTTTNKETKDKLQETQSNLEKANKELDAKKEELQKKTDEVSALTIEKNGIEEKLAAERAQRHNAEEEMTMALKFVNLRGLSDARKTEFGTLQKGILKLNDKLTYLEFTSPFIPQSKDGPPWPLSKYTRKRSSLITGVHVGQVSSTSTPKSTRSK
jgi:hypothetical protein